MDNAPQPPEATATSQHKRNLKRSKSGTPITSAHSNSTQPNSDQQLALVHTSFTEQQWQPNDHTGMRPHTKDMPPTNHSLASPMSTEEMMLRPQTQMSVSHSFPMDSSMHASVGPMAPYNHQQQLIHHGLGNDSFATNASFITDSDSQIMDRDDMDDVEQQLVPAPNGQKPASSRTSANNELEMRQLFHANRHRELEEVARELHGNERGPNSERARQVFAMLWINGVCTKGKGSVPRGRVYANYASRCATERITVLNPASFGKLVRVLFPGLKTRRLGVRGESKYHYVNFTLMDDQPELKEPVIQQPALPMADATQFAPSFGTADSQSVPPPTARPALPSPETIQSSQAPAAPGANSRTHSVYNDPNVRTVEQLESLTTKTMLHLAFPRDEDSRFDPSTSLFLPKIDPFLPSGTDPDSAKSLAALYRSHCISLVECIRYCKEKTFFHLYTSFQGTLTMPVQKLFAHPSLAPWIEQSDFTLYQSMVRIVAHLTLMVVPKNILDTLRNISEKLVAHIRESFHGQPRHVIEAKEAPAAIFAGLLDRALRVNLTAHAAANMLANPANRDTMYLDWIDMVRLRKVAECVPARGMDDLVQLLLQEMRGLLNPVDIPWDAEALTLYGDVNPRNGLNDEEAASRDGSALLDGWVHFLRALPTKFPYATPADIVWCVQRVGTEVMRDITIAQGKSFGSWWVTKCWLDEMVAFLAEQGGFMQSQSSAQMTGKMRRSSSTPAGATGAAQNPEGQRRSGSVATINTTTVSNPQAQPDRAPFPSRSDGQDLLNTSNPDDSGIGIRTPEEDFPMDKFEFQDSRHASLSALDLDQAMD